MSDTPGSSQFAAAGADRAVAVLGTGIMGSAMARNLAAAGMRTTVWDRSQQATARLASAGALVAASPRDAVRDARVVITMLPTADTVASVMFDGGVAEAFARGGVWAQMGTIGVAATTEAAARLGRLRPDVLFLDAPVSGSKGPAETGQLIILEGLSQSLAQEVAGFGVKVTLTEPSGYATDWAGPSARHATGLPAYDQVREQAAAARARRFTAPGDPQATRNAILRLVDTANPPLRMFLGEAPLGIATADYASRLATWREWQPLAAAAQGG